MAESPCICNCSLLSTSNFQSKSTEMQPGFRQGRRAKLFQESRELSHAHGCLLELKGFMVNN